MWELNPLHIELIHPTEQGSSFFPPGGAWPASRPQVILFPTTIEPTVETPMSLRTNPDRILESIDRERSRDEESAGRIADNRQAAVK